MGAVCYNLKLCSNTDIKERAVASSIEYVPACLITTCRLHTPSTPLTPARGESRRVLINTVYEMTKWKAVLLRMLNKGKATAPSINNASLHFRMDFVPF